MSTHAHSISHIPIVFSATHFKHTQYTHPPPHSLLLLLLPPPRFRKATRMDHQPNPVTTRSEAERLLGVAEKLLRSKDLSSARDFAVLAHETEPLLDGSDQIIAIIDVLLASEKRVSNTNRDWYAILQVAPRSDDFELIKKQYRRLAFLLHPDKNKFPFADSAFQFVADAWAVLADAGKKSSLDGELATLFTRVDLVANKRNKEVPTHRGPGRPRGSGSASGSKPNQKLPVRRSTGGDSVSAGRAGGGSASGGKRTPPHAGSGVFRSGAGNFWTSCPYCYNMYEYPREYEGCCLKCQNCKRAFTAVGVMTMPPTVPGKEAYYFCWGVFPMGFADDGKKSGNGFANWVPPMSAVSVDENAGGGGGGEENANMNINMNVNENGNGNGNGNVNENVVSDVNVTPLGSATPKKRGRGRPRKNP